jgi:hypothetical protein
MAQAGVTHKDCKTPLEVHGSRFAQRVNGITAGKKAGKKRVKRKKGFAV